MQIIVSSFTIKNKEKVAACVIDDNVSKATNTPTLMFQWLSAEKSVFFYACHGISGIVSCTV
uniref:Uncharacterized protein n=1 Tax=Rhizophora mucronata TaxID=61149 RepID=A0A2P2N5B8_RHIMU